MTNTEKGRLALEILAIQNIVTSAEASNNKCKSFVKSTNCFILVSFDLSIVFNVQCGGEWEILIFYISR